MLEDRQKRGSIPSVDTLADGWFDRPSLSLLPCEAIDTLPTVTNLKVTQGWSPDDELEIQRSWAIDEAATWILPVVGIAAPGSKWSAISLRVSPDAGVKDHVDLLRNLVTSSGVYAIASIAIPLINLVLAPFLTHNLSPADYGMLTILTTFITLAAGITQLGLGSAFFRAYGYDFTSKNDRQDVLATVTTLLCLISTLTAVAGVILAPFLAGILFGRSSLGVLVVLAVGVVLLQNLTVPGFAWLRAESRSLSYAILATGSVLLTLLANLVLVGVLHMGVAGSLIATGGGYAGTIICTIPVILARAGLRIRRDIAKSVLAFGSPLILSLVSYWVLQLSDRYLLSLFGSLAETARYAAAYTLGSAMSIVVIGPFTLAWPTTMFAIAGRKDAAKVFALVFRWFSMSLLLSAFGLSLAARVLLTLLFPVSYQSAAPVIPVVAASMVFYGIYFIFMAGANVMRKTWLTAVFATVAAGANVAFNLFLIPHFLAIGAAISTLLAYILLALVAYFVNQRIYFIPFELGRFVTALFIGVGCYIGSNYLASSQGLFGVAGIYVGILALYGLSLFVFARFIA